MRKLHLPLLSRDERQASASSGTAAAKARGSQVELAGKFEKGMDLWKASSTSLCAQQDPDALSLELSDPADSDILGSSSKSEDVDVVGDSNDSVSTESSQPNSSPAYMETDYTNIEGVAEHGFAKDPPCGEDAHKSSLPGSVIVFKDSCSAYVVAGQAGGALRTMAVLQAYNTDFLKDLYEGKCLSPEAKARSAALRELIPHRPKSSFKTSEGAGPSQSENHRLDQKSSMGHPIPPSESRVQRQASDKKNRAHLRKVLDEKHSRSKLRYDSNTS